MPRICGRPVLINVLLTRPRQRQAESTAGGARTMLFLLNDMIADIDIPEIHLTKRWKSLGCGDPHSMRAREALEFVTRVVSDHVREHMPMDEILIQDLGSLIIAKTGANAALFPVFESSVGEPRLTILPEAILRTLKQRAEQEGTPPNIAEIWPLAA